MKIVRVTAMWCMSCLVMKRVWKKVFSDYSDLEIIDLDYDTDNEQIKALNIGGVLPELIIYKDNQEVKRIIGEKSKKEMFKILEEINEEN
ncbi:MAG: thioredoxin family protein [Tenericutes bacterium]|nr:thioredoxin family protein [Mycoplasmatota bacterium]